ncbi:MAG: hypothetical protein EYC70_12575 [Planctomycetota bacterium]|nr:MAG: hypothetical protein EYC70_12575 [Planctomycetota bacterium]
MTRFVFLGLLAPALLLSACNRGSPAPARGPGGDVFSAADLAGDWVGVFTPSNPQRDSFNFYARFDAAGAAYEAADGLADQWTTADSEFRSNVDPRGNALVNLEQRTEQGARMRILGVLDRARLRLGGDFTLARTGASDVGGAFEMHRTSGAGHFSAATHLAGRWLGYGAGQGNHRKDIRWEIGADGTLLRGDMEVHVFIRGGPNTGIFQFSNDAVGRLDNVVIRSADGSVQTLEYFLVDDTGTLMGGPGADSVLGPGLCRLVRQP